MPYAAPISRANPTCFLFLVDQSSSMQDVFPSAEGAGRPKSQFVADALNTLLQSLVLRCAREEGIRPYFDVAVVGYGQVVSPGLSGPLAGRDIVSIADVGNAPARLEDRTKKVDDGAGGLVEQKVRKPIWVDPVANGGTPMCQALAHAAQLLRGWTAGHLDSFPPSVIHITDGESTDGDPTAAMSEVTGLATADGNCVLYNFHISASSSARELIFPDSSGMLPDQYSKTLFNGASPLVPAVRAEAQREGFSVSETSRGLIVNAQPVTIIQALDIGTKPSSLR